MANLLPTVPINIQDELENISLYKYHPNGILNISLNRLSDMLDGKLEVVEPSNPFTYLLETTCLNTAFAVQEYTLLTRKLYPRLANNERDLYIHMSDYDYLGIYSEPAYGSVVFNILFNDFKTKAYYDPVQKDYTLKLPRHLKVTVDNYTFTLTSAVIIRLTETEVIDVKFENQNFNNIFPIETNYINFNIYKVNQNETYINFKLKLPEIDIEPIEIPVEKSKLFKNTVTFNPKRKFYYFRAFYLESSGVWKEMIVTHTDEVYDIYNPTCIVKVLSENNTIEYYIPPVYVNNNMLGSKVKFLIYTTNGYIDVNFKDYNISQYDTEYNPVFPDEELDVYTEPLQLISKVIYVEDKVVGGKNDLDFVSIKNAVIDNSIGDRKLPITNKQLEFSVAQNNFKIIKDVDVLTNRVFLLETQIPNAATRYPISKVNLDIIEYPTTVNELKHNGNKVIDVSPNVTIIPENTIFKLTGEDIRILTPVEAATLEGLSEAPLLDELNNNKYVSTFYHYILDTSNNETKLRAYDISNPKISLVNFKEFNSTAKIGINSLSTNMYKAPNGYNIDVLSNLIKYVNAINETNVKPYLVFTDINGSRFYLEGQLFTMVNNNPVYRFNLQTNYYIDANNKINITNFKDINNNTANVYIDLNSKLEIIYLSNIIPSTFVPSIIDSYIYGSYLTVGRCVVTLEEITLKFGDYLEHLYSQVHTSVNDGEYQVYTSDVPLRYTSNVYDSSNNIVHTVGEIVLDSDGNPVIEHHAGDPVLDANGNMIPLGPLDLKRYLNLLFIDYKFIRTTNTDILNYVKFIKDYLTTNIISNAIDIQNQLLENTVGYVVVPKNINVVTVKTPYRIVNINCLQSFSLEVFVIESIYNNIEIRNNIEYTIISEIDKYLFDNMVINKNELLNILYNKLNDYIRGLNFLKFTELNDSYMEILNPNYRIGLNKVVVMQNNVYDIKEDVSINFIKV